jgi:hypothetical protein
MDKPWPTSYDDLATSGRARSSRPLGRCRIRQTTTGGKNLKTTVAVTASSLIALAVGLAGTAHAENLTVNLEVVAEGLQAPLALVQPQGDDRRFIVEQPGRIRVLVDDGFLLDEPFLDISHKIVDLMSTFDERGLLGLAFHPEFTENGRFFRLLQRLHSRGVGSRHPSLVLAHQLCRRVQGGPGKSQSRRCPEREDPALDRLAAVQPQWRLARLWPRRHALRLAR